MNWQNRKLKVIVISTVIGLVASQTLTSISEYCFCEPANPQLEISSISDCTHENMRGSDHPSAGNIKGNLKFSSQECISYFVGQILYTEGKSKQCQKQSLCTYIISSRVHPLIKNEPSNFIQKNDILPHNRFIDIISSVQLLI